MPDATDAANTALVTLRLDRGTGTISGTVATELNAGRPFWGWLELSEALDETRAVRPGSNRARRRGGEERLA